MQIIIIGLLLALLVVVLVTRAEILEEIRKPKEKPVEPMVFEYKETLPRSREGIKLPKGFKPWHGRKGEVPDMKGYVRVKRVMRNGDISHYRQCERSQNPCWWEDSSSFSSEQDIVGYKLFKR